MNERRARGSFALVDPLKVDDERIGVVFGVCEQLCAKESEDVVAHDIG